MTEEKLKTYKRCIFSSLLFYAAASFVYIGATALAVADNTSTVISDFALLLLKNLIVLFIFSLIFGFSKLIFKAKIIPNAVKWSLHFTILLTSTIIAYLLTAGAGNNPKDKIIFIIIIILLFSVVYSIWTLVKYLIKKKKR